MTCFFFFTFLYLSALRVFKEYEFELKEGELIIDAHVHSGCMVDSIAFSTNLSNTYGPYGGDGGGSRSARPEHPQSYLFAFDCATVITQGCVGMQELAFKWINFSER